VLAGVAAVAVAVAGADEAAQEHVLTAPASFGPWSPNNNITIQTGDTVTWKFPTDSFHNVESDRRPGHPGVDWSLPEDDPELDPIVSHPDVSHTFTSPGVYAFVCEAHLGIMDGTITVQDAPPTPTETATPTPTPTATATPLPTVSPAPTPTPPADGGHVTTPPPTGGADTTKPTLGGVRLTALRRAVKVRFSLSEPATVTVSVKRKGSRKVLKSVRVQARAGTRSLTLRSKKLKKGRYTVTIQARDAFGNRSAPSNKQLTIRR
jgi:plastocyanin